MTQSLFTSITGMTTGQTKLDVVANNIANMNTTAFKSSNLTFSDLYSRTLSIGSAPTTSVGGTNPMQVGLGVKLSGISTDFTGGSIEQTGNSNDLNIQGNGWFTVQNTDETIGLTRDGTFNLDKDGNLVTQAGLKVLGTSKSYSTSSEGANIWIPEELNLNVTGKNLNVGNASLLKNLNNAKLTTGTFSFDVYTSGGVKLGNVKADISSATSLHNIANAINTAIKANNKLTGADGTSSVWASVNSDGTFSINTREVAGLDKVDNIDFTPLGDSSNFLYESGIATSSFTDGKYTSKILSYQVDIAPPTTSANTFSKTSYDVTGTGAIEVTYSNGDTLTVEQDHENIVFRYLTSDGRVITANDIKVSGEAIKPANLQIQLASVQNQQGLISTQGNIYTTGPNSGTLIFSTGNANGFGEIGSGGLESSNVNLAIELANMLVAQRGIDANSRVFSTTSDVLERLVNLS